MSAYENETSSKRTAPTDRPLLTVGRSFTHLGCRTKEIEDPIRGSERLLDLAVEAGE